MLEIREGNWLKKKKKKVMEEDSRVRGTGKPLMMLRGKCTLVKEVSNNRQPREVVNHQNATYFQ